LITALLPQNEMPIFIILFIPEATSSVSYFFLQFESMIHWQEYRLKTNNSEVFTDVLIKYIIEILLTEIISKI